MGCPIKLIEGIALIKFENIVSCNQVSFKKQKQKAEQTLELTESMSRDKRSSLFLGRVSDKGKKV
jgi:hypothetical protein